MVKFRPSGCRARCRSHRAARRWRTACAAGTPPARMNLPVERKIVARGDEDDGNVDLRRAQPRLQVESRHPRHVHVEDHAIRTPRRQRCNELVAAGECDDLVVGQAQQATEHGAHGRLVVDYGDEMISAAHGATLRPSRLAVCTSLWFSRTSSVRLRASTRRRCAAHSPTARSRLDAEPCRNVHQLGDRASPASAP